MAELEPVYCTELDGYFHNPRGNDEEWTDRKGGVHEIIERSGWHFGAGDPEFWALSEVMLKPGGRVLDIGTQSGRASMFFALNGMHVTAYDTECIWVEQTRSLANSGLPELNWDVHHQDFLDSELEANSFDTILFSHTFLHMPSKEAAVKMIDKAWDLLKPGGVIWVRACGKIDGNYWELMYEAQGWRFPEIKIVNEDVIEHPCDCSGEERIDPTLFFDQTDLLYYFAGQKKRPHYS